MIEESVLEECCRCRASFNRNLMDKLDINNSPAELYICHACLQADPNVKVIAKPPLILTI